MNPLTCAEAFSRLDDYLDRELESEELAAVRAHLELCATCAGEFAVEREVLEAVREKLRRIAAPPDLLDRIGRRLKGAG
jgi:anti-sigma factor (TIGR02949 family)